jgi:hypothetical protein
MCMCHLLDVQVYCCGSEPILFKSIQVFLKCSSEDIAVFYVNFPFVSEVL